MKNYYSGILNRTTYAYKRIQAIFLGLGFAPPNFLFRRNLSSTSVVIDVGCADDADFSTYLIAHYGVKAFAVDPTRKHRTALLALESKLKPRFTYMPVAVSSRRGSIEFFESVENVSGSLLKSHRNILQDHIVSYQVESVTLSDLRTKAGCSIVDIIKLDIEGAEYELLVQATDEELLMFSQMFIEFHHATVAGYKVDDTLAIVRRLERLGFTSFSLDKIIYLFWRP